MGQQYCASMQGEYKTATVLEEIRHNTDALQDYPAVRFFRKEVPYGKGESQNSKAFNERKAE